MKSAKRLAFEKQWSVGNETIVCNGAICTRNEAIHYFRAKGHTQLFSEQLAYMCRVATAHDVAHTPTLAKWLKWEKRNVKRNRQAKYRQMERDASKPEVIDYYANLSEREAFDK